MRGELVVDERGRTSLARVRSHAYERYIVEEFPDGTLVLTPAVTISAVELAALEDSAVRTAIAEAKTGDRSTLRRRPSSAQPGESPSVSSQPRGSAASRDDEEGISQKTRNEAIIAVLRKAGRPMRIPEILDALIEAGRTSERNTDVQFYLSDLAKRERIVRIRRGVYALPGR